MLPAELVCASGWGVTPCLCPLDVRSVGGCVSDKCVIASAVLP